MAALRGTRSQALVGRSSTDAAPRPPPTPTTTRELGARMSSREGAVFLAMCRWPDGASRWDPRKRRGVCYHCGSGDSVRRNLCVGCRITSFKLKPNEIMDGPTSSSPLLTKNGSGKRNAVPPGPNPYAHAGGYRYCQGNCSTIPRPMTEFSVKDAKKCDWCLSRQASSAKNGKSTPRRKVPASPGSARRSRASPSPSAKPSTRVLRKAASFSVKKRRRSILDAWTSGDDSEDSDSTQSSSHRAPVTRRRNRADTPPMVNTGQAAPPVKRLVTISSFRMPGKTSDLGVPGNPPQGYCFDDADTVYTATPTPGSTASGMQCLDVDLSYHAGLASPPHSRPPVHQAWGIAGAAPKRATVGLRRTASMWTAPTAATPPPITEPLNHCFDDVIDRVIAATPREDILKRLGITSTASPTNSPTRDCDGTATPVVDTMPAPASFLTIAPPSSCSDRVVVPASVVAASPRAIAATLAAVDECGSSVPNPAAPSIGTESGAESAAGDDSDGKEGDDGSLLPASSGSPAFDSKALVEMSPVKDLSDLDNVLDSLLCVEDVKFDSSFPFMFVDNLDQDLSFEL